MAGQVKLYVVKKGETIKSISQKFAISEYDILRLNPYYKFKDLYGKEPLTLIITDEKKYEENKEIIYQSETRGNLGDFVNSSKDIAKEINNSIKQTAEKILPTNNMNKRCELKLLLQKYCLYIKDNILSKAFIPESFQYIHQELHKIGFDIIELLLKDADSELKNGLHLLVKDLSDQIITLISSLANKNTEEVKNYKLNVNNKLNKVYSYIENKIGEKISKDMRDIVASIIRNWETYTINVATIQFAKAQDTLNDLLTNHQSLVATMM